MSVVPLRDYLYEFLGFPRSELPNISPPPPGLTDILPGAWTELDAREDSSLTYDGSNLLSVWNDLSGNNNHYTTDTAALPVRTPNAVSGTHTAIVCPDQVSLRRMKTGLYTAYTGTAYTAYAVAAMNVTNANYKRLVGVATGNLTVESSNTGGACLICKRNNSLIQFSSRRNNSDFSLATGGVQSQYHVLASRYDGVEHTMFLDGVAATPVAFTSAFNEVVSMIFNQNGTTAATSQWVGGLGHLILYRAAHTNTEVQDMSTFLASDWGL